MLIFNMKHHLCRYSTWNGKCSSFLRNIQYPSVQRRLHMYTKRREWKHKASHHSNLNLILVAIGTLILSMGTLCAHAQSASREDLQKQIHNFEANAAQADPPA